MSTQRKLASCLMALWILALAPALAAQEASHRSYPIRFLDIRIAELLVWEECKASGADPCDVRASGRHHIEVLADSPTHARIVRMLATKDVEPETQAFQLILLAARLEGTGSTADLPENARRALEDVGQFLPFRGFELLDLAWIRTTERATALIAGPDGREFSARLRFTYTGGPDERKILLDAFELYERVAETPPAASAQAEGESAGHTSRVVLATSFGMEVGETVVVGTSKLDGGDGALIVLLTAVP